MDRANLIEYLSKWDNPLVLTGLATKQLEAMFDWHNTPQEKRTPDYLMKFPHPLPCHKISVYRINWSDGAQYVGMTGQDIMDRLCQHFEDLDNRAAFAMRQQAGQGIRTPYLGLYGVIEDEGRINNKKC